MISLTIKNHIYRFFFSANQDYSWIVFFRISIAAVTLLHFISILPDFDMLFSTHGVIPSDILDVYVPNFVITLPKIIYFFESYDINEFIVCLLFKLLYTLFCLSLLIGFYPRITAMLLLFLQIALIKGSPFYAYGVDYFTSMSLFYLILIPSHYKFSVHTFLKHTIKKIHITPYRRCFQLHLSIAYFFSGLGKILGFNWWNGASIWKAINLPFANQDFHFNFSILADYPIILILAGWATIITEMFYPIFIWIPKTRSMWLYLTLSMHFGIALVLNLYFFSAVMMIWNITNFYFSQKCYKKQVAIC